MSRPARLAIGVLLFSMGALWTLQGLGYVGGSAMSGNTLWAVVGPIVAVGGLGIALSRPRNRGSDRETRDRPDQPDQAGRG